MHSVLAFAGSASIATSTTVPSRTTSFRQSSRAPRLQSRRLAAPLFSYSLAPIREGYELLFPPARPHPFVFSYAYNSLGGQPLCFDNHPHCPGVWGISPLYLATRHSPLATSPLFSYACSLFARSKKANSFAIKQIQPLFRKCRGVGVGIPNATTGHPGWGCPSLGGSSECSAVPLGRHLCFQQLMEMRPGCTATQNERCHTASYPAVQAAPRATWTRRTHPIIIAARSRSQVHG
jgi:hypothetical protein